MKALFLTALLLLGPLLHAQNRDYKKVYQEGVKLLNAGDSQGAIKQLNLAMTFNDKPERYKLEGTFFDYYLPRYKLALAYEKTNILEAESWLKKSKDAREDDVIKDKPVKATYLEDYNRIAKAADDKRQSLKVDYDIRLGDARKLLDKNRFDEAKNAFEALVRMDPSRTEARSDLDSIDGKRNVYLRNLELDAKTALLSGNLREGEDTIRLIESVDRDFSGLPALRNKLSEAKDKSRVAAASPKETPREPVREPAREPVRSFATSPEQKPPVTRPEVQVRPDQAPAQIASRGKANVRSQLLASLAEYRRGNTDKALNLLSALPADEAGGYASYHWLRGLYLLQLNAASSEKDQQRERDAAAAMAKVAQLMPAFEPDTQLYPAFVISFYQTHRH